MQNCGMSEALIWKNPELRFNQAAVSLARLGPEFFILAVSGDRYEARKYLRARLAKERHDRNGPTCMGRLVAYRNNFLEYGKKRNGAHGDFRTVWTNGGNNGWRAGQKPGNWLFYFLGYRVASIKIACWGIPGNQ